jgi:hypothetical protein
LLLAALFAAAVPVAPAFVPAVFAPEFALVVAVEELFVPVAAVVLDDPVTLAPAAVVVAAVSTTLEVVVGPVPVVASTEKPQAEESAS